MTGSDREGMKTALITGVSSGLGLALARKLVRSGYRVYGTVRREEDFARIASEEKITPLAMDVANSDQVDLAVKVVSEKEGGLDALINNAGVCVASPLECVPLADLRWQFDVNVFGVVALTQKCLPLLRKRSGRIVLVGSAAGRIAMPFLGPYAASKFALEAIADSWRRELSVQGIFVSLLQVGSIVTPIWGKLEEGVNVVMAGSSREMREIYGGRLARFLGLNAKEASRRKTTTDDFAEVALRALTAKFPKARYTVGADARINNSFGRFVPDNILDRFFARALR